MAHLLLASLFSVLCFTQVDRKISSDPVVHQHESMNVGTAPVAIASYTVGNAICDVVNEHRLELNWRFYEFVKLVYDQRAKNVERHRAAFNIRPETVGVHNGAVYYPGANRYYRETGIWPEKVC